MKNVLGTTVSVYEIIKYFGEVKPIKCKKCEDWFECSALPEHESNCDFERRQLEDIALSPLKNEDDEGRGDTSNC